MSKKYTWFEVCECPKNPTEEGKYVGKTPVYEQALTACEKAKANGKTYFIKAVKADGTKVVLL